MSEYTSANSHTFEIQKPFVLKGGGRLEEVVIQYETWGELSPSKDNAILLCHALTGDSHAIGWWGGIVGEGKPIDTSKYFVVYSNVLGGCDGTTGPFSQKPKTKREGTAGKRKLHEKKAQKAQRKKSHKSRDSKIYGRNFPIVTIRDMVRIQNFLTDHLGVKSWKSVIGGSMGGMQALEWAVMFPEKVRSIAPLCSTLAATPWQIAFSFVGRNIIGGADDFSDSSSRFSRFRRTPSETARGSALAAARSVAMISYRSDELFESRFAREQVNPGKYYGLWDKFQVESYLEHQGNVLSRRFHPDSYLILNKAMDLHDIGRDRGGITSAAGLVRVPTLVLSVDSDLLYPVRLQEEMAELIGADGTYCEHHIIDSPYGHDGFLLEAAQVGEILKDFLDGLPSTDNPDSRLENNRI